MGVVNKRVLKLQRATCAIFIVLPYSENSAGALVMCAIVITICDNKGVPAQLQLLLQTSAQRSPPQIALAGGLEYTLACEVVNGRDHWMSTGPGDIEQLLCMLYKNSLESSQKYTYTNCLHELLSTHLLKED